VLNEAPLQGVRDRVLLLRALPAFSSLDDETLIMMAEHSRRRAFRAGETVCVEGRPLTHGYLVLSGQITSTRKGERVTAVTRGYGVGMLSILANDDNGVHAVADSDASTIEIPARAMNEALEISFPMLRNSLRMIAAGLLRQRAQLPASPDNPPKVELGEYPERPATVVDHLLNVRASGGLFAEANLNAMLDISRAITEIRLEEGDLLWSVGDAASWWVRIGYGAVRCTSPDGQSVDVGHGWLIGMMDSYAQGKRAYEARAKSRLVGYRTELEDSLAILENHTDLARELVASMAMQALNTPAARPSLRSP
jgi:CRP-like cAMP-binding protein